MNTDSLLGIVAFRPRVGKVREYAVTSFCSLSALFFARSICVASRHLEKRGANHPTGAFLIEDHLVSLRFEDVLMGVEVYFPDCCRNVDSRTPRARSEQRNTRKRPTPNTACVLKRCHMRRASRDAQASAV